MNLKEFAKKYELDDVIVSGISFEGRLEPESDKSEKELLELYEKVLGEKLKIKTTPSNKEEVKKEIKNGNG